MPDDEAEIERLARILAANAGLDWAALARHPGYLRTIWREKARVMLLTLSKPDETPPRPDGG